MWGNELVFDYFELDLDPKNDESEDFEDSEYDMQSEDNDDRIGKNNKDDKMHDDLNGGESGENDILNSDDDLDSCKDSDGEIKVHNYHVLNLVELYDPTFESGMIFSTKAEVHAKCVDKYCGWKLHALKLIDELTFQIRQHDPTHICARSFFVKNIKSKYLSGKNIHKFKSDCKRNMKGFRVDVIEDNRCHISNFQAYRAKRKAIEIIEGILDKQYYLLWDYGDKIKRTNPRSTVILGTNQSNGYNRFDRFYMCLNALKMGFFAGYLNIEKDYEWTFMSDKQKGLIQAYQEVFPNASHWFCARHMHSNFKITRFRGQAFKGALWKAAMATIVNEFRRKIDELSVKDERAAKYRSHFKDYLMCDMLLNNGCETFNCSILEAREKFIMSMLEWIMEYLLKRIQENKDRANEKWKRVFCPKIQKVIDKNGDKVGDYIPIKVDDYHYQFFCFDGTNTVLT
ncbi:hypothetical protein Pfo_000641 [Paulownia fortunei]|nr:hypothetical protein Pfo_000641 [Paulownia fortunei]